MHGCPQSSGSQGPPTRLQEAIVRLATIADPFEFEFAADRNLKREVDGYGADADEVGVVLERELELWQDSGGGVRWGVLFEAPILTTLRRKGDEFYA